MKRWKKAVAIAAVLTVTAGAGAAWAQTGPAPDGSEGVAASPGDGVRLLGNGTSESKFVPITPCRLVDTRNAVGPFANGQARSYDVKGTGATFAAQGGKANGCGIPAGGVTAVEVTVTAVQPSSNGYVRVYPGAEPQATFMNYPVGFSPSNTGTVALCGSNGGVCLVNNDLRVKNYGGPTQIVVDVQGYYTFPMAATVNANGTLARNSRAVSATRLSEGWYSVVFDRNVTSCAFNASIGYPTPAGTLDGEIQVQYNANNSSAAFISTSNPAGVLDDRPFNVTVTC